LEKPGHLWSKGIRHWGLYTGGKELTSEEDFTGLDCIWVAAHFVHEIFHAFLFFSFIFVKKEILEGNRMIGIFLMTHGSATMAAQISIALG